MALDIKDGLGAAGTLKTTLDGADHVPHHHVDSSALPTGAATAALQTTGNGILTTIDTDTGSISTSASAINGKITACNTGAVVLSSGTVTTVSTVTNLSQLGGAAIAMGTGVRSAGTQRVTIATDDSVPVTGTFWQATQPVSLTSTTITGTVAATQSGTWNVTNISGTISLPTGAATSANQTTIIGHVDGIETTLTSIDGKITACNTGAVVLAAGTAAIGKLAANSGVDIGDVDVTSLPALAAGTNLIGKAAAGLDVSNLYDGSTALVPKFAKLSSASTGNQALVSAVVGKKIRVLAMHVMATASTNAVYINDGTADLYADSTRKIPLDVTGATGPGGFSLPFNPVGWFETAATNRPLNVNLGSANGVVAVATYVEV